MPLTITRRKDQSLLLAIDESLSAEELRVQLLEGILITVELAQGSQTRLQVKAPKAVRVIRPEAHDPATWQGQDYQPESADDSAN